MGDNVRITVSRRRFGDLSDGRKGEKNAKYVPPTAEVTVFALEKGFAATKLDASSNASATGQNNTPQPFDLNDTWSTGANAKSWTVE